jgi:F-type H+-transporting ATPase subunit delta
MKNVKLATRYAKALFQLAKEQNIVEQVRNDMILLNSVCKSNKDFKLLLSSPIIHPEKKQSVFNQIFGGNFSELSLAFINLIAKKRREGGLEEIGEKFEEIYKDYKNIKTAYVKTAIELDAQLKDKILQLLKTKFNSEIDMITEVNKDLIGGFVISVDDELYDASIINKINLLSRDFEVNIYERKF